MPLGKGRAAGQLYNALERRQGLHRPQLYAPTVVANSAEDAATAKILIHMLTRLTTAIWLPVVCPPQDRPHPVNDGGPRRLPDGCAWAP